MASDLRLLKFEGGAARAPPAGWADGARKGLLLRAGLVVGLAAAGLGEAAADHVADGENRHVQPRLPGAEAAVVGLVDDAGGDEDADHHRDVREELARLERGLRLGGEPAGAVIGVAVAPGDVLPGGVAHCAHRYLRRVVYCGSARPRLRNTASEYEPAIQRRRAGNPGASYNTPSPPRPPPQTDPRTAFERGPNDVG